MPTRRCPSRETHVCVVGAAPEEVSGRVRQRRDHGYLRGRAGRPVEDEVVRAIQTPREFRDR
eukprot:2535718-Lingulodinium_polyedra.AAC.1